MKRFTVCRPLQTNVPERPPGASPATCDYCGAPCWILATEPCPLPAGYVAACTACALRRGTHQREMDAALAERRRTGRS